MGVGFLFLLVHLYSWFFYNSLLVRGNELESISCPDVNIFETYEKFVDHCPKRETIDIFLSQAAGLKSNFFSQLKQANHFTRGLRNSGLRLNTTIQACFIGDSITREVRNTWNRITPFSNEAPLKTDFCTSLIGDGENSDKYEDEVAQYITDNKCGLLFIGGSSSHCLVRHIENSGSPDNQDDKDPLSGHINYIQDHFFEPMEEISLKYEIPTVFIGAPIIESDLMILRPAKTGWDEFHELSLSKLWSFSETQAYNNMYGKNLKKCGESHCSPPDSTALFTPSVRYFNIAKFHLECPGFRCDGMHVVSTIPGCNANDAFYDFPLAKFALESGLLQELKMIEKQGKRQMTILNNKVVDVENSVLLFEEAISTPGLSCCGCFLSTL